VNQVGIEWAINDRNKEDASHEGSLSNHLSNNYKMSPTTKRWARCGKCLFPTLQSSVDSVKDSDEVTFGPISSPRTHARTHVNRAGLEEKAGLADIICHMAKCITSPPVSVTRQPSVYIGSGLTENCTTHLLINFRMVHWD